MFLPLTETTEISIYLHIPRIVKKALKEDAKLLKKGIIA